MNSITVYRGDTIPLSGVVSIREAGTDISSTTDFSTWKVRAQVRAGTTQSSTLLAEAVIDFVGSTREFKGEIAAADTAAFPDRVYLGLRFVDGDGVIQSSKTIILSTEDAISQVPL